MENKTIATALKKTGYAPQEMLDCIQAVQKLATVVRMEARKESSFAVTTAADTIIAELSEYDLALEQYQDDEPVSPDTLLRDSVLQRAITGTEDA